MAVESQKLLSSHAHMVETRRLVVRNPHSFSLVIAMEQKKDTWLRHSHEEQHPPQQIQFRLSAGQL